MDKQSKTEESDACQSDVLLRGSVIDNDGYVETH